MPFGKSSHFLLMSGSRLCPEDLVLRSIRTRISVK